MDDQQRALLASRLSTGQQAPVSPADAMRNFWVKAFTYNGRASRAEYNWALAFFLLYYGAVVAAVIGGVGLRNSLIGLLLAVALLMVFIVPWFALIARRCHDINRPGAFGLLLLATGIGFLVTEGFFMFSESDPLGTRFDPESPPAE
jgi:uncharacterized membrane protein YhaH (DUF805 family)